MEAGLSPEDMLRVSQAGGNFAQSAPSSMLTQFMEDPETGARFATRGNTMQPSGTNPKKIGVESFLGDLAVGTHVLGNGKILTIKDPADNTSRDRRMDAQTFATFGTLLEQTKQDISAWNRQAERAKKEKGGTQPDPVEKKKLERMRDRYEKMMEDADEEPASASAPAAAPSAAPAKKSSRPLVIPIAGGGSKVLIEKDGKEYYLPSEQLEEAMAAGYKRSK